MQRETLNLYLDALWTLTEDKGTADRHLLIEEAIEAESLLSLLSEWAAIQDLNEASALKMKVWFGLSYTQLSELWDLPYRQIVQMIRSQRAALLPTYPPTHRAQEATQIDGLSCFMVEQNLSSWLDGECDLQMVENLWAHIHHCADCEHRLTFYRDLQTVILAERSKAKSVSEDEWNDARLRLRRESLQRKVRGVLIAVIVAVICLLLGLVIWTKPEKMPNIYEIEGS